MKKFLLKLSLFTVILMILAIVADFFTTNLLRRSNQLDYGVWNDLFDGRVNANIVIHGSSKAWVQVNTSIVEKEFKTTAHNLGLDAFGFNMQHCRHKLLLKYNKKPQLVIHVVDVNMFDDDSVLYDKSQFLPYIKDSTISSHIRGYRGLNFFERNIPFYRYVGEQGTLKHAAKILFRPELNVPDRHKGFAGQQIGWNDDYENARKKFPQGIEVEVHPAYVNLFEDYIKDCLRQNIKVVLVYAPEFKEGREFQRNSDEIIQIFQDISTEYNVPFHNFRSRSILDDRKYFYNNNHLNAEGADLFTQLMCREIKALDETYLSLPASPR